ncbi:FtsX-like permease family protein [Ruminococcaceae bacterium YRB3002]|nr:FtsX-like permease family protein [Ruminococcaceae bacterium YRB3002]
MKKTQFKDAYRNILKQIVSYLSILVIALIGAASFMSVHFASLAMSKYCNSVYDDMNYRTIEVIATKLLNEDDLDALKQLDGFVDIEPVWQVTASATVNDSEESYSVTIITLCERINTPILLEGCMPSGIGECVIESRLADKYDIKVGDVLSGMSMEDAMGEYYEQPEELKVTGIVIHPDHLSLNLDEGYYVMVNKESFDMEALRNCCVRADILLDTGNVTDRFSEAHKELTNDIVHEIENLAEIRTPLRDQQVIEIANEQIDEYKAAYNTDLDKQMIIKHDLESRRADLDKEAESIKFAEERLAVLTPGSEEYLAAKRELDSSRASYNEKLTALEEEETDNDEKIKTIQNMLDYLEEQRSSLDEMEPDSWIVLDEYGSPSFVQLAIGANNLSKLESTFAAMFIVISALVIYATVSKIIDEQRYLVGTSKAMGLYNREILAKYLIFGVTSTMIGLIAGILIARFAMETIAIKGYNDYFIVDFNKPILDVPSTLAVLAAGILLSVGAVIIACYRLIREPATVLMAPPVPKGTKKKSKSQRSNLPLYTRLIWRNIRTDWKRVLVTVVSVGGCCALIVTGITLKNAVESSPAHQYGEIVDYDLKAKVFTGNEDILDPIFDEAGTSYTALYDNNIIINAGRTDIAELMCGNLSEINRFFHLNDWKTGEPLTGADDGILIPRRMAEVYELDIGSEMLITVNVTEVRKVRVAGVFENYIGSAVAMSDTYYQSLFGAKAEPDTYFVSLNGTDENELFARFADTWEVKSWSAADADRSIFDKSTEVINSVVVLFIVMAAIMAGVVLLNLTMIYVIQKTREMTVMRINGFTTKQVISYAARESIATTLIGIILGIAVGSVMAYRIVRAVENTYGQFDRNVSLTSWLIAAIITILFAVIVNIIALRRVKKLNLTDI